VIDRHITHGTRSEKGRKSNEVGVGFIGKDRVMDPVHVRGDHQEPQQPIDPHGDKEVAMVEHGRSIQKDFKDDDADRGGPQDGNGSRLDSQRNDNLEGMKSRAGGHVVVHVRVVHHMQTPQNRDRMKHDMLHIDDEVQDHDGQHHFQPEGPLDLIEDAPTLTPDP